MTSPYVGTNATLDFKLVYIDGRRGDQSTRRKLALESLTDEGDELGEWCRRLSQDPSIYARLSNENRKRKIRIVATCFKQVLEQVGMDLQKHIDGDGQWLFSREAELIMPADQTDDTTPIETSG